MKLKTKLSKLRHDGHITDAEYSIIINALNKKSKERVQQPCEDAISREEAIRVAEQGQIQGYEWQFKKLCNLPSVTPQRKTGKWIKYCYQNLSCSNCGYIAADTDIDEYKYCPNCGCRMIEPQESESDD